MFVELNDNLVNLDNIVRIAPLGSQYSHSEMYLLLTYSTGKELRIHYRNADNCQRDFDALVARLTGGNE